MRIKFGPFKISTTTIFSTNSFTWTVPTWQTPPLNQGNAHHDPKEAYEKANAASTTTPWVLFCLKFSIEFGKFRLNLRLLEKAEQDLTLQWRFKIIWLRLHAPISAVHINPNHTRLIVSNIWHGIFKHVYNTTTTLVIAQRYGRLKAFMLYLQSRTCFCAKIWPIGSFYVTLAVWMPKWPMWDFFCIRFLRRVMTI